MHQSHRGGPIAISEQLRGEESRRKMEQLTTSAPQTVRSQEVCIPRMMSIITLADLLGVCPKSVTRWIKDGRLKAHKLGGRVLIAEADAAAFIAAGRR
jgi:excisionase family DNA binding protein